MVSELYVLVLRKAWVELDAAARRRVWLNLSEDEKKTWSQSMTQEEKVGIGELVDEFDRRRSYAWRGSADRAVSLLSGMRSRRCHYSSCPFR